MPDQWTTEEDVDAEQSLYLNGCDSLIDDLATILTKDEKEVPQRLGWKMSVKSKLGGFKIVGFYSKRRVK